MKHFLLTTALFCSVFLCTSQNQINDIEKRVTSKIDSTYTSELTLIQEFIVNVPVDSVFTAYSTKKGWESWAVAIAEVDFKINGTIKTNYNKDGKIGDATTIYLNIKNHVPNKLITLQAELSEHFPEFMKADEKNLYNIIYFEAINDSTTKVTSYGIGYKNNQKYKALMKFFITGNEKSYINLITYLETGKPVKIAY
ncbi:SRPBCC domain-containing protein [Flaviramulus sp. BrNp1-15]|uniref:SRPBCC family protein n=1 Tax=Flaviramulus sp. BrNp1-15 TaxID=2916754 RepID=UPI001EE8760A|nr:SRPBCC domain-containing protein [Flaviramulus sp. BrNp1-15]ULC58302.1 SRPBCC domain-containing protein [Flaviramulus sp. BrNp1-15]